MDMALRPGGPPNGLLNVSEKPLAPGLEFDVVHGPTIERLLTEDDIGLRRMAVPGRRAIWLSEAVGDPVYLAAIVETVAKRDANGARNVVPGLVARAKVTRLRLLKPAVVGYVARSPNAAELGTVDEVVIANTRSGLEASAIVAKKLLEAHTHLAGISWPSVQSLGHDVFVFYSDQLQWPESWQVVSSGPLSNDGGDTLAGLGI